MLNKRIRELRIASGMSQVDLAEKMSVTKQTISNWENDNIQPSVEMLIRLADIFCVTTDDLLGRSNHNVLDVEGLSTEKVAHLSLLIQDLKK